MNHISKLLLASAIICATISCSNNERIAILEKEYETSSTAIVADKVSVKDTMEKDPAPLKSKRVLACDVLPILKNHIDKRNVQSTKDYTLNTIYKNGNPMLHIVNYKKGGWAIIAGNKRNSQQILATNENGYFDPSNITNSNVAFWFDTQLAIMETIEFENPYVTNNDTMAINSIPPFNDEYVWVRLPLEPQVTTSLYSELGHLLTTKWGQGYPWNYNCPTIDGLKAPTGCVAVAVAQLLYYFHFNFDTPRGLYHSIIPTYTQQADYYTSSVTRMDYQPNSDRWQQMATSYSYRNPSTDYVGDLMIDIGSRIGMQYRQKSSGAIFDNYKDVFSLYGLFSDAVDYNPNKVISTLKTHKPVLISSKRIKAKQTQTDDDTEYEGHAWVIDGYKCYRTETDNAYKWVIMPPDSLSFYNNINYDYVLTDEEKRWRYPNVYEGLVEHNYTTQYQYYLKMNWGYDGSYDNNDYDTGSYSWVTDGKPYNTMTKMIYDFKPVY